MTRTRLRAAIAATLAAGVADLALLNLVIAPAVLGGGPGEELVGSGVEARAASRSRAPGSRVDANAVGVRNAQVSERGGDAGPRGELAADRARQAPAKEVELADPPGAGAAGERGIVSSSAEIEPLRARVDFDSGEDSLDGGARRRLRDLAERMEAHPDLALLVEGHADRRGDAHYNQRLSERRARRVAAFLRARGVEETRIRVRAFGERKPLVEGRAASSHKHNRRVEMRFLEGEL